MRLHLSDVLDLAQRFLHIPADVGSCEQIAAQLPQVVDAIVAGEEGADRFPGLMAHLAICHECRRNFEEVLEIARMAEQGALVEPDRCPQLDFQAFQRRVEGASSEEGRGQLLTRLRRYLREHQGGLVEPGVRVLKNVAREGISVAALVVAPLRLAPQPGYRRAPRMAGTHHLVYQLDMIGLQVTLKAREFERHRFTVRGLVEADEAIDGLVVCLLSADDGQELLDCTRLGGGNTFTFHDVRPGRYSIRLDISAAEAICLADVEI